MVNINRSLTKMENLLETFDSRRNERIRRRVHRMGDFIGKFSQLQQSLDVQRIRNFNILKILNISSDEVRHSFFLAWLLDSKSGHNQGFLFFNAFMQLCEIGINVDQPYSYTVKKEFSEIESTIDILIYRKSDFLVYIENKIYSAEGKDQCAREVRDMCRLGSRLLVPVERQYAVFLTPDGREPVTSDSDCWRTLSYHQLGLSFKQLMPQITLDKVRYILEDWLEVISNFYGGES